MAYQDIIWRYIATNWYGGVYGDVWCHIAIYHDIRRPHPTDFDVLWCIVLYYGLSWRYMGIYRDKLGHGGVYGDVWWGHIAIYCDMCHLLSDSNVFWYIVLYYGISWHCIGIYSDKLWRVGVYGAVWWGHIAIYRDIRRPPLQIPTYCDV